MPYDPTQCSVCGKKLDFRYTTIPAICDKCQVEAMRKNKPVVRDFPIDWTMDDKNAKAREMGLSYGRFVALVHDGTLNIKELTKPEHPNANPRRVVRHRGNH